MSALRRVNNRDDIRATPRCAATSRLLLWTPVIFSFRRFAGRFYEPRYVMRRYYAAWLRYNAVKRTLTAMAGRAVARDDDDLFPA